MLLEWFRPVEVRWGATAAAFVLILVMVWYIHRHNLEGDREAITPAEQHFLTWVADVRKEALRSGGAPDEAPLTAVQPHLTIIRSPMPELVAEASGIPGPFTFEVNEVRWEDGEWVAVKTDVAQTQDNPVDKPRLALTKPLERGKVYAWRVSAGKKHSAWAYFMVAARHEPSP
ncbi:MAG: hypothetical protein NZT92_15020 [Abditibacteriales bacterium]|nr:hypothetical protein [Abditibacteriales bacterium]MDW8364344.1 hypothetical protein [Abditibacteriales bacterium]